MEAIRPLFQRSASLQAFSGYCASIVGFFGVWNQYVGSLNGTGAEPHDTGYWHILLNEN